MKEDELKKLLEMIIENIPSSFNPKINTYSALSKQLNRVFKR